MSNDIEQDERRLTQEEFERGVEARYLSDPELRRIEENDRCRRSVTVMSLIKTINEDRQERAFTEQVFNARIAELKMRLDWFEQTYSVRAYAPLYQKKSTRGLLCPHCKTHGAGHVGRYWLCFNCSQQWEQEQENAVTTGEHSNGES